MQDIYTASTNIFGNTGLLPLQGFHFKVWAREERGQVAWLGDFASMTLSIRNATQPALELGQNIPQYLDGEIQIAWVLEQHLQDFGFITRTFGTNEVGRNTYTRRTPRFQISFDVNAENYNTGANPAGLNYEEFAAVANATNYNTGNPKVETAGRYDLIRCKVDSLTMGVSAGRQTGQVRIEGVSEGFRFDTNSIQTFKTLADSIEGGNRRNATGGTSSLNLDGTGLGLLGINQVP